MIITMYSIMYLFSSNGYIRNMVYKFLLTVVKENDSLFDPIEIQNTFFSIPFSILGNIPRKPRALTVRGANLF